jgi:hypothetical protein
METRSSGRRMFRKNFSKAIALALLVAVPVASEAFAKGGGPARPAARGKPTAPYVGDCGPNPPPGYRYDLKNWRSGFNRDFSCYVLDEY